MNIFQKIKNWYSNLPEKKKYIEFFSALLTVPMLVTVIMINVNNLNNNKKASTPAPAPTTAPVIQIIAPSTVAPSNQPSPSVSAVACKNQVGPVNIVSPDNNQVITKDPVNIDVSYTKGTYCGVVWSYRINGGDWSAYSDKLISLYNLTPGEKQLEVKVKSIGSTDEVLLKKTFTYQVGSVSPAATPTVSPTSAPSTTPTPTITPAT